jgi:hypothetical protein
MEKPPVTLDEEIDDLQTREATRYSATVPAGLQSLSERIFDPTTLRG